MMVDNKWEQSLEQAKTAYIAQSYRFYPNPFATMPDAFADFLVGAVATQLKWAKSPELPYWTQLVNAQLITQWCNFFAMVRNGLPLLLPDEVVGLEPEKFGLDLSRLLSLQQAQQFARQTPLAACKFLEPEYRTLAFTGLKLVSERRRNFTEAEAIKLKLVHPRPWNSDGSPENMALRTWQYVDLKAATPGNKLELKLSACLGIKDKFEGVISEVRRVGASIDVDASLLGLGQVLAPFNFAISLGREAADWGGGWSLNLASSFKLAQPAGLADAERACLGFHWPSSFPTDKYSWEPRGFFWGIDTRALEKYSAPYYSLSSKKFAWI